ncbi:MAG: helix-turn-helix transcriptional regulator [Oscillospiraceae bacterium]|nr:helix-turn-helix transcriptional regulator [Oscillospiraceae bacterium]
MSTGENIQFLRKREGFTQESFAEQMGVSRQTISKWESDSCFPEMEKLLQMCEMFHCNLDDLVRGNVQADVAEDTAGYDAHMNLFAKQITTGVVLVLIGVTAMLLTYGLSHLDMLAGLLLFPFLIAGVAFLVTGGMQHEHYTNKHPQIVPFYTEEEQDAFHKKFIAMIVTGISLVLVGVVCIIGAGLIVGEEYLDTNDFAASLAASLLMAFVTAGTGFLIYGGMQKSKYDIEEYNQENTAETEGEEGPKNPIVKAICASIMVIATLIFLMTGFLQNAWHINWVVYVAGALLCAVVNILGNAIEKSKEKSKTE